MINHNLQLIYLTGNTIQKNHIYLEKNGIQYELNLQQDLIQHIFNIELVNTFLEQYQEQQLFLQFHDIIFISIWENHDRVIREIPDKCKELYIRNSFCEEILFSQANKEQLKIISIDYSNICRFPNFSEFHSLERIILSHSNLNQCYHEFPNTLLEFNVLGNNLNQHNFSFDKIKKFIMNKNIKFKLNMNDNHFHFESIPQYVTNKYLFLRQKTYRFHFRREENIVQQNIHHFIMENKQTNNLNVLTQNNQTVHLSSINKNINKSIEIMKNYIIINQLSLVKLNSVDDLINEQTRKFIKRNMPFFKEHFMNRPIHTSTKMSYIDLLSHVWTIMMNHKEKNSIWERFQTEIGESNGYCFTGQVNRLMNVLVYFVEGIKVSISMKEEIQNSISVILPKIETLVNSTKDEITKRMEFHDLMCEVENLFYWIPEDLKEEEKITVEYKEGWMNEIVDTYKNELYKKVQYKNKDGECFNCLVSWEGYLLFKDMIVGEYIEKNNQIIFWEENV
jgi:hypothetical protein